MPRTYLKRAEPPTEGGNDESTTKVVQDILDTIEKGGDAAVLEYAKKFDKYEGNIILTKEEIEAACALVPGKIRIED